MSEGVVVLGMFAALLWAIVTVVLKCIDMERRDEEIRRLTRQVDDLEEDEHYTSTACYHEVHRECRRECKFCEKPCLCECHDYEETPPEVKSRWNFLRFLEKPTYDTVERMR